MSHWMTSGRSRLKAKQDQSFQRRAKKSAALLGYATSRNRKRNDGGPKNIQFGHPRFHRRTAIQDLGSTWDCPIARRGIVAAGKSRQNQQNGQNPVEVDRNEQQANEPPVDSRRIRSADTFRKECTRHPQSGVASTRPSLYHHRQKQQHQLQHQPTHPTRQTLPPIHLSTHLASQCPSSVCNRTFHPSSRTSHLTTETDLPFDNLGQWENEARHEYHQHGRFEDRSYGYTRELDKHIPQVNDAVTYHELSPSHIDPVRRTALHEMGSHFAMASEGLLSSRNLIHSKQQTLCGDADAGVLNSFETYPCHSEHDQSQILQENIVPQRHQQAYLNKEQQSVFFNDDFCWQDDTYWVPTSEEGGPVLPSAAQTYGNRGILPPKQASWTNEGGGYENAFCKDIYAVYGGSIEYKDDRRRSSAEVISDHFAQESDWQLHSEVQEGDCGIPRPKNTLTGFANVFKRQKTTSTSSIDRFFSEDVEEAFLGGQDLVESRRPEQLQPTSNYESLRYFIDGDEVDYNGNSLMER